MYDYASYSRRRRANGRIDLRAYKLMRGCLDCGYDTCAEALEFDHTRGSKSFDIPTMKALPGSPAFVAELAKCDVVCANCHAIRTAQRRVAAKGG